MGVPARWWRRPVVADGALALVVLLVDLVAGPFQPVPLWLWTITGVLLAAPLAVRRRWPVPAGGVVLVGGAVWVLTHADPQSFHFALVATLGMQYTLLVHRGRRCALGYALLLVVGLVAWSAWRVGPAGMLGVLWLAFVWAVGSAVVSGRARVAEAALRAATEERLAVAREMHDVIAHALSVIVVHADGAAVHLRTDPDRAEQAVRTVAETGRAGLTELRRVLDVLRNPADGAAARVPRPGEDDLAALAERMTAAGLPTRLTLESRAVPLPVTVSSGLYRIAQESLTNALRHAGDGARASVELTNRPDAVVLTVRDDGVGAGPAGGGGGLVGMRERARACGGTLTAGPDPERGGWLVRAELPL